MTFVLDGVTAVRRLTADALAEEERTDRLTVSLVIRSCTRHQCLTGPFTAQDILALLQSGQIGKPEARSLLSALRAGKAVHPHSCPSRNHRRDSELTRLLTDILGLSGEPARHEDYTGAAAYHGPLGRKEAREFARGVQGK
jgi:hypothetical protein